MRKQEGRRKRESTGMSGMFQFQDNANTKKRGVRRKEREIMRERGGRWKERGG